MNPILEHTAQQLSHTSYVVNWLGVRVNWSLYYNNFFMTLTLIKEHSKVTYHNEANKVYPVPEAVSILYKIHDVSPTLQRYNQENCNPCKTNVVKRNSPMKRICRTRCALCVVLKMYIFKSILQNKMAEKYLDGS